MDIKSCHFCGLNMPKNASVCIHCKEKQLNEELMYENLKRVRFNYGISRNLWWMFAFSILAVILQRGEFFMLPFFGIAYFFIHRQFVETFEKLFPNNPVQINQEVTYKEKRTPYVLGLNIFICLSMIWGAIQLKKNITPKDEFLKVVNTEWEQNRYLGKEYRDCPILRLCLLKRHDRNRLYVGILGKTIHFDTDRNK